MKRSLGVVVVVGSAVFALMAQDAPHIKELIPQSETAVKARHAYAAQVDKANEDYHTEIKKSQTLYQRALETARKEALAKKDLDETQRIVVVQKDLESHEIPQRGFAVLTASWGVADAWADVTPQVLKGVRLNVLFIPNLDQVGFPDTAFGKMKALVVVYSVRGKVYLSITPQGQTLSLPDPRINYP